MEPFTAEQCRVLGCLVEKEATVPDSYPLTLNALRAACNQTSNRDPVVDYDERAVTDALTALKERRVARFVHPSHGERATKYRHVLDEAWGLAPGELAVLAVLVLRGPQTPGELRARTERYPGGSEARATLDALDALAGRDEPLVVELPRQPGQKEQRWAHLLEGDVDLEALATAAAPRGSSRDGRLDELEAEVAELRRLVDHLYGVLGEDRPGPGRGFTQDIS